jgi:hypothetical protein
MPRTADFHDHIADACLPATERRFGVPALHKKEGKHSDEGCQSAKPHFGFGENPAMKLDDATVLEILALL